MFKICSCLLAFFPKFAVFVGKLKLRVLPTTPAAGTTLF